MGIANLPRQGHAGRGGVFILISYRRPWVEWDLTDRGAGEAGTDRKNFGLYIGVWFGPLRYCLDART